MKISKIKRALISSGMICLALVFLASDAFPWGYATHAYIDDHIGENRRLINLDEIYGGMAPDIFNYMFDNPEYLGYLSYQTHNGFMNVWEKAKTKREEAFGYGFVSHNDVWGADSTAHHSGITYGQTEGYVIAKAEILKPTIVEILTELASEDYPTDLLDEIALDVSHELVENGIDILMKRLDPEIGEKIALSALHRNPQFPRFLVRAYAEEFSAYAGISYPEASYLIKTSEKEFRESMIFYGQALMQDEETAIQLISQQTAYIAESFLGAYGIILPDGTDLVPLITFAIQQSIEICADDFSYEIEATINYVEQQMNANDITY
jgi:3D (Asp-Asp-Asp) domain-containing protein